MSAITKLYNYKTPEATIGNPAAGAPGWVNQGDLLRILEPDATVRGDTFVIRAYGEAQDAGGNITARAYAEAVVQRVPEYVDPVDRPSLNAYTDHHGGRCKQGFRASHQAGVVPLAFRQRNLIHMICKFSLSILAVVGLSLAVHAQGKDKPSPVRIRAVLHDPVHPTADLFYIDQTGAVVQVEFQAPGSHRSRCSRCRSMARWCFTTRRDIDPENPSASLAASAKLPPDIKRAIVVVLPAPAGEKPAYRMLVIDDSAKAFPNGESLVLSLVGVETAIKAGEHTTARPSGEDHQGAAGQEGQ